MMTVSRRPQVVPGKSAGSLRLSVRTPSNATQAYQKRTTLSIGDVEASAKPAHLHTVLGSCVAVCLHDPVLRAGGMNHILLPGKCTGDESQRYGVHAMELLINRLMALGCDRSRLVAKVFGGANLLQQAPQTAIGTRNIAFVRGFLELERIPLIAERLGGDRALQVNFYTDSSRATVQVIRTEETVAIAGQERSWKSPLNAVPTKSDVTLF